ncbi:MAG: hypothetical protein WAU68_02680 [Vitreimonas sp.]
MRAAKLLFLGLESIAAASCTTAQSGVTATASPALVGTWHQVAAECAGAEPVSELIFEPGGHYSVTWVPFETYKDYWGAWRYDARTRVLTLTVEGGNYQPADRVLSGEVSADAHQLTLGALSLGSPHEGARCSAAFRR